MKSFKKSLAVALVGAALTGVQIAQAAGVSLNGAGATFPYPIYSKWFYEYNKATGVQINYQSIGSGGGIQQLTNGTVDFGASDAPMTDDQISKVTSGVLHFPTVAGAVAVAYNVQGVDKLKLNGAVLTDIFMGTITKWNDPAIAALNPDATLPDLNITVAHRSDGSGTSNIFTNYLTKVNTKWAGDVGFGTAVKWPVGVGGKGNEGVAGLISQIPGTIGYVELAYAIKNKMTYASIKNRAGNYIEPSLESTTAAADGALRRMPKDFRVMITDSTGEKAYPICGFTWLLINKNYKNTDAGKAITDFLGWYMDKGEAMAADLYYAPLPDSLLEKVKAQIDQVKF
jgi:phosphate transport system substrate-binding protein